MIALSQCAQNIQYLRWIPSESGPLITQFGSFPIEKTGEKPLSINDIFHQISDEVKESPSRFHVSLDHSQVHISQSYIMNGFDEVLEWQLQQRFDPLFNETYDTYHYPNEKNNTALGLHIKKSLKMEIIDAVKSLDGEIRSINVGIFSAEMGARQWFHANQFKSYLIWKLGKGHMDYVLAVEAGEFQSLGIIKRFKGTAKLQQAYGDTKKAQLLADQMSLYCQGKLNEFNDYERVFAYNCVGSTKEIKQVSESTIANLVLLNPFQVLELSSEKQVNPFKGTTFAETGAAFRGVDV